MSKKLSLLTVMFLLASIDAGAAIGDYKKGFIKNCVEEKLGNSKISRRGAFQKCHEIFRIMFSANESEDLQEEKSNENTQQPVRTATGPGVR